MKFNKKFCLLFLMTILVLLLGAGYAFASEAGDNSLVIEDNNKLSTPLNYDVDNVVQSDIAKAKSEANVEKTSTNDTIQSSDTTTSTFVNTNRDKQITTSNSSHGNIILNISRINEKSINSANLVITSIKQESIDNNVKILEDNTNLQNSKQISDARVTVTESDLDYVSSSEKMTPIFTDESQKTEENKNLVKVQNANNVKTDDDSSETSDERYTPIIFKDSQKWLMYQRPWLMNDTTWVFSLQNGTSGVNDPGGSSSSVPPGIYKRITLTDDYEIIHPKTNENILPYIRTLIYNYMDSTFDGNPMSNDLQQILSRFTNYKYDYTNSSTYGDNLVVTGKKISYYVNETYDQVQNGNGISSSGSYKGSDYLTYQFYLYQSDDALNTRNYFDAIGYKIYTNINVTKVWNDTGFADQRPDNLTIQLFANGKYVDSINLNELNDWKGNFSQLPVYEIYDFNCPMSSDDYELDIEDTALVNLTVRRTGTGIVYYNITANGKVIGDINKMSYSGKVAYFYNKPKYDSDGNEIVYKVIRVYSDGRLYGSTNYFTLNVSDEFTGKKVTVKVNNHPESGRISVGLFRNGASLVNVNLTEDDDWTFSTIRVNDPDSDYALIKYSIINVVDYTIGEVELSDDYRVNISSEYVAVDPLRVRRTSQIADDSMVYDGNLNKLLKSVTLTNTYVDRPRIEDSVLKYVTNENSIVSNGTYSPLANWYKYYQNYYWSSYGLPFLMNDTTWAYCVEEKNHIMPNGKLLTEHIICRVFIRGSHKRMRKLFILLPVKMFYHTSERPCITISMILKTLHHKVLENLKSDGCFMHLRTDIIILIRIMH